jgi:hypothetical protein
MSTNEESRDLDMAKKEAIFRKLDKRYEENQAVKVSIDIFHHKIREMMPLGGSSDTKQTLKKQSFISKNIFQKYILKIF